MLLEFILFMHVWQKVVGLIVTFVEKNKTWVVHAENALSSSVKVAPVGVSPPTLLHVRARFSLPLRGIREPSAVPYTRSKP